MGNQFILLDGEQIYLDGNYPELYVTTQSINYTIGGTEFNSTEYAPPNNLNHILIFAGKLMGGAVDIINLENISYCKQDTKIGIESILFLAVFNVERNITKEHMINFLQTDSNNRIKSEYAPDFKSLIPLFPESERTDTKFYFYNCYKDITLKINDKDIITQGSNTLGYSQLGNLGNKFPYNIVYNVGADRFMYTHTATDGTETIFKNTSIALNNGVVYKIVIFAGKINNDTDTEATMDNLIVEDKNTNYDIITNPLHKLIIGVFLESNDISDSVISDFLCSPIPDRRNTIVDGTFIFDIFVTFITLQKVQ
jgi:hypothetical protein